MKSFFYLLFSLLIFSCSTDGTTKEVELKKLQDLESEIQNLVDAGICTENKACAYIAFGSKPCGGPMSYLVYSTAIDVELLKTKVAEFNTMQENYNREHNLVSDCMAVTPPAQLVCDNGKCKAQ